MIIMHLRTAAEFSLDSVQFGCPGFSWVPARHLRAVQILVINSRQPIGAIGVLVAMDQPVTRPGGASLRSWAALLVSRSTE